MVGGTPESGILMISICVDYADQEAPDQVGIRLDLRLNSGIDGSQLRDGLRVKLYDETTECDAIVRAGEHYKWVGHLIRETIHELPEECWKRLERK
jgi:hypothetical protein